MQRLFSTFPNGWPGRGLLLLRLAAVAPLLENSVFFICGVRHSSTLGASLAGLASGVLLAVGFYTPVAALAQIALEMWAASQSGIAIEEHVILGALGLSLIMLGPGAWSVDAHLYGRKRIDLRSTVD